MTLLTFFKCQEIVVQSESDFIPGAPLYLPSSVSLMTFQFHSLVVSLSDMQK